MMKWRKFISDKPVPDSKVRDFFRLCRTWYNYIMYVIEKDNEYIMDDSGKIQRFKNPTSARDFLRDHGIRKPEKEGIRIIPEKDAAPESAT